MEERRTVVAIDKEQSASVMKAYTSRKRSSSLSPSRNRIYNSGHLSSYQSRRRMDLKHQDSKMENRDIRKNDRRSNIEKHREYKDKYTERDTTKHDNRSRSKEPRNSHSRYKIKSLI